MGTTRPGHPEDGWPCGLRNKTLPPCESDYGCITQEGAGRWEEALFSWGAPQRQLTVRLGGSVPQPEGGSGGQLLPTTLVPRLAHPSMGMVVSPLPKRSRDARRQRGEERRLKGLEEKCSRRSQQVRGEGAGAGTGWSSGSPGGRAGTGNALD